VQLISKGSFFQDEWQKRGNGTVGNYSAAVKTAMAVLVVKRFCCDGAAEQLI